jgi:tripartite-type tricarboxylate transporter receptor subunit TctC
MASAEMKEKYASGGSKAISTTPREFAAFIKEEIERWAPVVRASGARVE